MTLIINNDAVKQGLTMETTMAALMEAYLDLARGDAVKSDVVYGHPASTTGRY